MNDRDAWDAVVIGAGIAGLCAAGALVRAGRRVLVLEKSRGIGGRMATRRVGGAVCDHGAQFFTVRGRAFGGIVAEAHAAGVALPWCDGFAQAATADGPVAPAGAGHARWRGARGMTDLPKRLAEALAAEGSDRCTIRTTVKATAIGISQGRVRVTIDEGEGRIETLTASGGVLTAPVPQSLDLMAAGDMLAAGGPVDPETRRLLETVSYDPCFALLLVLDRPSRVPPPGAIQFAEGGGPIAWLADNQQKGISAVPALTVHASGGFSREHFDAPQDEVAALLLDRVRPWIDGDPVTAVVERSLHRWKFALPTRLIPAPLVAATPTPPIVCCGDAFAGPRVEGAASSGLAAGRWLTRVLDAPPA